MLKLSYPVVTVVDQSTANLTMQTINANRSSEKLVTSGFAYRQVSGDVKSMVCRPYCAYLRNWLGEGLVINIFGDLSSSPNIRTGFVPQHLS